MKIVLLLGLIAFTVAQDLPIVINNDHVEDTAIRITGDEQAEAYIKFKYCSVCENGSERNEVGECQCPERFSGTCCNIVDGEKQSLDEIEPWGGEDVEDEVVQKNAGAPPKNRWFRRVNVLIIGK